MCTLMRSSCRKFNGVITHTGNFLKNGSLSNRPVMKTRDYNTETISFKNIGPIGYLFTIFPIGTFCLGTWQVKRLQWKKDLIAELQAKTKAPPRDFPENLDELEDLEFYRVIICGTFDHSKEMYIGPRPLLVKGDVRDTGASMMSSGKSGYHVVTPFKFEDRDLSILVNRGWVSRKLKDPNRRLEGQTEGVVSLSGIIRKTENRAPFMPENTKGSSILHYRDIPQMASMAGTSPVFVDAVETEIEGPIGGQTRANLRNEHLSYILTWYSLSLMTSFLWFRRFVRGKSLM